MSISIQKAKINNDATIEVAYLDTSGEKPAAHEVKYSHKAHPDLIKAFKRLTPHFVALCELTPMAKLKDCLTSAKPGVADAFIDKHLGEYRLYNFSVSEKKGSKGIVLSATRKLSSGKSMTLNSPFTTYDDNAEYEYATELAELIGIAIKEVESYVDGKESEDDQESFDLELHSEEGSEE